MFHLAPAQKALLHLLFIPNVPSIPLHVSEALETVNYESILSQLIFKISLYRGPCLTRYIALSFPAGNSALWGSSDYNLWANTVD